MTKKGMLAIAVGIIAFSALMTLLIAPEMLHRDFKYSGSSTFYSEEEYLTWKDAFKNEVAASSGSLIDYSVLASEPPIIVSWEVGIPHDQTFSFGGASESVAERLGAVALLAVVFGSMITLGTWALYEAFSKKVEKVDEASA